MRTDAQVIYARIRVFAVAAALMLVAGSAQAQATRTWVSGVGDDANPCSRTAPCKTFAGAMSKTVVGGYIDALDPGGFGAVTITHAITIDGGPGHAGVLVSGTDGIVINIATSESVVLRNLSFEGAGMGLNGVNVVAAGNIVIENCVFNNFSGRGISHNSSSPGFLLVSNTSLFNNAGGGIYVQNARATITHVRAERNGRAGVEVGTGAIATVSDTVASSQGMGFAATAGTAVLNLSRSVASHNDFGLAAGSGATIRIGDSDVFSNNAYGLFNDGSSALVSFGNNRIIGNPTDSAFTSTVAVR